MLDVPECVKHIRLTESFRQIYVLVSLARIFQQRMINDLRMVFRDPAHTGSTRMANTPSPAVMLQNLDNFLKKWNDQKHEGHNILPCQTIEELNKLKTHIEKGCLSNIPPSGGTNRNEALHKTLRKNISRQRIGVQLALALLGISFYIWNENRENLKSGNKKISHSIQTFYSSFLATSETPTTERFGISASEDKIRTSLFSENKLLKIGKVGTVIIILVT